MLNYLKSEEMPMLHNVPRRVGPRLSTMAASEAALAKSSVERISNVGELLCPTWGGACFSLPYRNT